MREEFSLLGHNEAKNTYYKKKNASNKSCWELNFLWKTYEVH